MPFDEIKWQHSHKKQEAFLWLWWQTEAEVLQFFFEIGVIEIAQYSQEITCVWVSFWQSVKTENDSNTGVFTGTLRNVWDNLFYRTSGGCFCGKEAATGEFRLEFHGKFQFVSFRSYGKILSYILSFGSCFNIDTHNFCRF